MLSAAVFLLAAAATPLVSGHFGITYPTWRADTLSDEDNSPYSQWTYPCAGASASTADNRTDWPVTGGALELELHHPWTYLFVNLGLGGNVSSNFNISLTPQLLNVTGKGTFCLPTLPVPEGAGARDGQPATLQVVTSGDSGSALYNCADITFRANASTHQCTNSSGIVAQIVDEEETDSADNDDNDTNTAAVSTASSLLLGVLVLAVICATV